MHQHCCKPLRLIELFVTAICFSYLFFLTRYQYPYGFVVSVSALTFLFTAYTALLIILLADVVCELSRFPIANIPMLLALVLGALACFVAGVVLAVFWFLHSHRNTFRELNMISLLAASSWFCSLLLLVDAIILIRFV